MKLSNVIRLTLMCISILGWLTVVSRPSPRFSRITDTQTHLQTTLHLFQILLVLFSRFFSFSTLYCHCSTYPSLSFHSFIPLSLLPSFLLSLSQSLSHIQKSIIDYREPDREPFHNHFGFRCHLTGQKDGRQPNE